MAKKEARDRILNKLLKEIVDIEGGEFIEADGTLSFHGLNQKTADAFFKSKGRAPKDVRSVNFGELKDIFLEEFVNRNGINRLPDDVLPVVVDFAFNSGPKNAALAVQNVVGAKKDAIIGPQTNDLVRKFIKDQGKEALVNSISDERINFLNRIAKQNVDINNVLNGLVNRVNRIREVNLKGLR